jgi:hypothetical protein
MEKEQEHHIHRERRIIVFSILGAILLITLVFVFGIPMPYTATEQYTEKEPVTAPVCEIKDYEYVPSVNSYVSGYATETTISYYCDIANNEDKAGEFSVKGRVITYNSTTNEKIQESVSQKTYNLLVSPKQTARILVIVQNILAPSTTTKRNYECFAAPPTKEVCKEETTYKDLAKKRTLTKYASLFKQWTRQVEYEYSI